MLRSFLITATLLLTAVFALVIHTEFFAERPRAFSGKLEDTIPKSLAGWQVKDVPLADSAAGALNVEGILNFDQVVQRIFVKDGIQVMVYVAYWEPGKISLVDAGSHNPDSCWVNAGCQRTERAYSVAGKVGPRHLLPYEWGEYMTPSGGKLQAMFWHLVDGRPNRYETQQVGWRDGVAGRIERSKLVINDIQKRGLNQRAEQMFVRLSSNKTPEELLKDPDARWLLDQLSGLGIFADQPWR